MIEKDSIQKEEEVIIEGIKWYPHFAPAGKFIGEYLIPPFNLMYKNIEKVEKFKPYARQQIDQSSAATWYHIGPSLMLVHSIGRAKMLRDSLEEIDFEVGDIIIPQGNVDTHIWNNKIYCTIRFDNVISIIKKDSEDHKIILKHNKLKL